MNAVDYLRVSLIDRCNFRCQYCMPDASDLDFLRSAEVLSASELLTLMREVFIPAGFTRFRLTGGEPLLRSDVLEIVQEIVALPQVEDLAMTTNAFLLESKAQSLFDAGLRRINISLGFAGS